MKTKALTYSAPCTACGDEDHDRTVCEHAPTSTTIEEIRMPDVIGWRGIVTYADGRTTTAELSYDPRNDRLATYGIRGADGQWTSMAWRGRQPVERGVSGARAYALAFFHGADLPATEDPR